MHGGYKELEINFEKSKTQVIEKLAQKEQELKEKYEHSEYSQIKESFLVKSVQNLITKIFDLNIIDSAVKDFGYDIKKIPLGNLGDSTIKEAYTVLTKLLIQIDSLNYNKKQQILDLSGQFYTLIPHDFGFEKMMKFKLDSKEIIHKKLEMLQALTDMKILTNIIQEQTFSDENMIDSHYSKLKCHISPLYDPNQRDIIMEYIDTTKENNILKIKEIYQIQRHGEKEKYKNDIGNDMLLWHGSSLSNFVGILSQGMRIAPPEAPINGYNYGKGIYFADMLSKSITYCRSTKSNNDILILLCQVAVGKPNVLEKVTYQAKEIMPEGCSSTLGWGTQEPNPKCLVLVDGVKIPIGYPIKTKSTHHMHHNEFVVYDQDQVQLKYLVSIEVDYSRIYG